MDTITKEPQLARRRFLAGGLAVGAAALLSSPLCGMGHAATLSAPSTVKSTQLPHSLPQRRLGSLQVSAIGILRRHLCQEGHGRPDPAGI